MPLLLAVGRDFMSRAANATTTIIGIALVSQYEFDLRIVASILSLRSLGTSSGAD